MARQNAPVRMGGVSAKYIHNHWGDGMAKATAATGKQPSPPPLARRGSAAARLFRR